MQSTSSLYKKLLEGKHFKEVKLVVGNEDFVFREDSLVSLKTSSQLFSKEDIVVGSCVSSEINVMMIKPNAIIPRNAKLTPFVRLSDGTDYSEWVQKGVFYVDTREDTPTMSGISYLSLHGYDAMLQAEQDYPNSNMDWPARDILVVEEIANALNWTIDDRTYEYLNANFMVQYPAEYSCRETLGFIASMYAGCFVMSDLGKLRFVPFYTLPKETNFLLATSSQFISVGGDRILV